MTSSRATNGKTRDICGYCLRVRWDPETDGAVSLEFCTGFRGDRCELVAQNGYLKSTMLALIRSPGDAVIIAQAKRLLNLVDPILDERCCPLCNAPYVLMGGRVQVHFTRVTDKDPCPASFRHIVSGVLK